MASSSNASGSSSRPNLEMGRSITESEAYGLGPGECFCPAERVIRTVHTGGNTGRQFFGCGRYKKGVDKGCGYLLWIDPPNPPCSNCIDEGIKNQLQIIKDTLTCLSEQVECKDYEIFQLKQQIQRKKQELDNIRGGLIKYNLLVVICLIVVVLKSA